MGDLALPSRRDRAIAALVSAAAATGIYLIVSLPLGALAVFVFGRLGIGVASGADADSMRAALAVLDASIPGWVSPVILVIASLSAWYGVARGGRGMTGDAVGAIRALGRDGAPASRGRTLLRAGIAVAIAAIGIAVGRPALALLLLVASAVVGIVRTDRRGLVELAAGVHLESTAATKFDREERREQLRADRRAAEASTGDEPRGEGT